MCFSLEVSFLASGALLTVGAIGFAKTRRTPMKYLAAIPLLFGIQQGIEGLQWLVDKPSLASTIFGYAYLFFAFIIWPFYTPFSVWMIEQNAKRRKLLRYVVYLGLTGSVYLLIFYASSPLSIYIVEHSIVYDIYVPLTIVGMPLYVVAVCSGLWSTRWRVRLLGWTTLVGFIVTVIVFRYAFTAVWCFFAAVLSAVVLVEVYASSPAGLRKRR